MCTLLTVLGYLLTYMYIAGNLATYFRTNDHFLVKLSLNRIYLGTNVNIDKFLGIADIQPDIDCEARLLIF